MRGDLEANRNGAKGEGEDRKRNWISTTRQKKKLHLWGTRDQEPLAEKNPTKEKTRRRGS